MFRFSPSEIFCSVCQGGKMIFLCPGFLLGLIFVYGCSLWGGPAVMGGGTKQHPLLHAGWCEYRCPVWTHANAAFLRLEVKLNLAHISWQVKLVMFFLRQLQPHFEAKPEKHEGEDFRHWFARPILTRGVIMCCGKLTRLPEAACVKIPVFFGGSLWWGHRTGSGEN